MSDLLGCCFGDLLFAKSLLCVVSAVKFKMELLQAVYGLSWLKQFSAVRSNTSVLIRSNTLEFSAIHSNTSEFSAVRSNTSEFSAVRSNTSEFSAIRSSRL